MIDNHEKIKWFRLINIVFIFLPIVLFTVFNLITASIYSTIGLYNKYIVNSYIYLSITSVMICIVLLLLTQKPHDLVFTAFLIGISRSITLNAIWGGWNEIVGHNQMSWPGTQTVYDFAYYGLQFFFSAMTPILFYIGTLFASNHTHKAAFGNGISYKYLIGLIIMGVSAGIFWSAINEYGIFVIWGLENFTPNVAVWYPQNLWFFGVPWIFWFLPISAIGVILSFCLFAK